MTTTPAASPPLLTDDDVRERVESLVGPALVDRRLWLFLVDGDRRQVPVDIPIEDLPARPELVETLARMLGQVADAGDTDAGPGSAVFVLERTGPGTGDGAWRTALESVCESAGLGLLGVFTATADGVRRVR